MENNNYCPDCMADVEPTISVQTFNFPLSETKKMKIDNCEFRVCPHCGHFMGLTRESHRRIQALEFCYKLEYTKEMCNLPERVQTRRNLACGLDISDDDILNVAASVYNAFSIFTYDALYAVSPKTLLEMVFRGIFILGSEITEGVVVYFRRFFIQLLRQKGKEPSDRVKNLLVMLTPDIILQEVLSGN